LIGVFREGEYIHGKISNAALVGKKDNEAVTSTHIGILTLHFQMSVERMLHTRTRSKLK